MQQFFHDRSIITEIMTSRPKFCQVMQFLFVTVNHAYRAAGSQWSQTKPHRKIWIICALFTSLLYGYLLMNDVFTACILCHVLFVQHLYFSVTLKTTHLLKHIMFKCGMLLFLTSKNIWFLLSVKTNVKVCVWKCRIYSWAANREEEKFYYKPLRKTISQFPSLILLLFMSWWTGLMDIIYKHVGLFLSFFFPEIQNICFS